MKATIYTTEQCPWCHKAKALLKTEGIAVEEHLVDTEEMKAALSKKAGKPVTTVPQIWLDDEYVGGYSELAAKFKV